MTMMAGPPASTSRVREHKEIPSSSSNIDRQYHHEHLLVTQTNKQSQQPQSTKSLTSSRLLSSSISTSVEPQPPQQQQQQQLEQPSSSSGSMCSSSTNNMTMNRRNKLSHQQQQHTRFTSHINPMSPTTASSVSDVVASPVNTSDMPPPLPLQDKTDIFHLHHIDQAHSTSSTSNITTNINICSSSDNTTTTTTTLTNTPHMKSQLPGQVMGQTQQQQHYQMLRGRHKEDVIVADKHDYATSSFTNVDDLTNAIRNKVIVEEDEEDILSSDNTYLY